MDHPTPSSAPDTWFDAHLDLAYLALMGRDMRAALDRAAPPHPPAAVTLPALVEAGVVAMLGTIFTEPDSDDPPIAYGAGDALGAHEAGVRQLAVYEEWRDEGWIGPLDNGAPTRPGLGILMENADPIRDPSELGWWSERGVVAVGMAWARPSRYAGGNDTKLGLTDAGRDLADAIDQLGLVHDLSHLSQRATDELLARTTGRVVATHSNCRALLDPTNERHLADETIREIGRRAGVIGLNLFSPFLTTSGGRACISDCVRHVEHVCEVTGSRATVGLGSDADGGFSADRMPDGIERPSGFRGLIDALGAAGWDAPSLEGFRYGNWARYFGI